MTSERMPWDGAETQAPHTEADLRNQLFQAEQDWNECFKMRQHRTEWEIREKLEAIMNLIEKQMESIRYELKYCL